MLLRRGAAEEAEGQCPERLHGVASGILVVLNLNAGHMGVFTKTVILTLTCTFLSLHIIFQ